MGGMIYDGSRIRAYENLKALCSYAGETPEWCDALWREMLRDGELYEELLYYMRNNTFRDRMRCRGCTLIDLFARQMDRRSSSWGGADCDDHCGLVDMVLRAFADMARMKRSGK
ncbi:MAG: hypothetical protein DBX58_07785 [Clostridiales bacterium]|nr:MAG: hypothetical protein DBX58_07785 [Clostridiales bacterium]